MTEVMEHLELEGVDKLELWEEIRDIIRSTITGIEHTLVHSYKSVQPKNKRMDMCFQILAFNILIDDYGQPWLIKVDNCHSLSTNTKQDTQVKESLLKDTFRLLNLNKNSKYRKQYFEKVEANERILNTGSNHKNAAKRNFQAEREKLKQLRYELKHLGNFEKIPAERKPANDDDSELSEPFTDIKFPDDLSQFKDELLLSSEEESVTRVNDTNESDQSKIIRKPKKKLPKPIYKNSSVPKDSKAILPTKLSKKALPSLNRVNKDLQPLSKYLPKTKKKMKKDMKDNVPSSPKLYTMPTKSPDLEHFDEPNQEKKTQQQFGSKARLKKHIKNLPGVRDNKKTFATRNQSQNEHNSYYSQGDSSFENGLRPKKFHHKTIAKYSSPLQEETNDYIFNSAVPHHQSTKISLVRKILPELPKNSSIIVRNKKKALKLKSKSQDKNTTLRMKEPMKFSLNKFSTNIGFAEKTQARYFPKKRSEVPEVFNSVEGIRKGAPTESLFNITEQHLQNMTLSRDNIKLLEEIQRKKKATAKIRTPQIIL